MMTGARLECMRAVRAGGAAGWPEYDRRAFVVRLVGQHARCRGIGVLLPGLLECGEIALGAIADHEFLVAPDAGLDEVFGGLLEDRPPLQRIAVQQRIAAEAFESCRELPAEIDHVIEAVIKA